MGQQALKTPPHSPQEYRRQKGPVPMIAIFLVICFLAVLIAFFLPAFLGGARNG
jgi:hypothetical protein